MEFFLRVLQNHAHIAWQPTKILMKVQAVSTSFLINLITIPLDKTHF